ncbi:AAA domain-containing protein, partial [Desulforamulus putei DSM 12395]
MTKANCLLLWVKTVEIKGNRCAIYARVSTKKQADNGNLIRQLERLQGIAKRRKYAVVAEYQEVASGLNENRKELSKLLKIIAGGQVNIVLIEYRDRLARFGYKLSTGTVMDFFRGLVTGLGEEPKFRKVDLFHQIQKAVLTFYQERKITPVFILDEMQLAKDLFLHDLSIIFNFGMDSENPFILVISGLPYM